MIFKQKGVAESFLLHLSQSHGLFASSSGRSRFLFAAVTPESKERRPGWQSPFSLFATSLPPRRVIRRLRPIGYLVEDVRKVSAGWPLIQPWRTFTPHFSWRPRNYFLSRPNGVAPPLLNITYTPPRRTGHIFT